MLSKIIEPSPLLATKINGLCRLPKGYELAVVQHGATFEEPEVHALRRWPSTLFHAEPTARPSVSCNYNFIKIIVSLVQLLYAISTLYRTRGDQIAMYGYAAFGLTVAPYAWMSLINLIGNLIRPQYDAMFVVESEDLDQLRARIKAEVESGDAAAAELFMVTGTVGRLTPLAEANLKQSHLEKRGQQSLNSRFEPDTGIFFLLMGAFYLGAVPIAIVGGLSHFAPAQSALYQRVWTMMWLVFGFAVGATVSMFTTHRTMKIGSMAATEVLFSVFYAAPAIGGYVVVAQMINEFGVCELLL